MTGASSGIGRAIAETYAAAGAEVLITHRASPERAQAVAEAIAARGGRARVAQAAVARAVVDSVREGVISEGDVDDLCLIVGVFIHWDAKDDKKIFDYNYQATKESIARALGNQPSVSDVLGSSEAARHPFAAGVEG